ncbi:molybdate transporter 2 [Dorcoceras hygrometricum]|uniref:Molybdate transporter 2 n=1 Tax=Dorcoceras hygrometricum TaxID=472368 RepID=A0A2Z7B6X6_9LAMI|nr:molybdate transporter 2 [Dorcoceras hygrometricum]
MTVLPLNSRKPRTCVTLNGSGIQLAVGRQPLWLRNHNSELAHRIMVKRLATSPHDPLDSIGYPRMSASGESSTTMHRLLHASGSHPIPTPYDPMSVGKRVKVTRLSCRVSMTFRVVRTNQYNQDLGRIHSTNGNHLQSPKEGSSIDHQLMSNVEQEADNSKCNSEESDVVLKNQQMVRVQQMATVEWIQQKRKDKDSADDIETTASWTYKEPAGTSSKNDQQAATVQPVKGTQVSDSKTMRLHKLVRQRFAFALRFSRWFMMTQPARVNQMMTRQSTLKMERING